MPAPGDQHANYGGRPIVNPFEEVKPHISEYTAQEIATLQSRLEKQLGPEYISSRSGPGGLKIHYLAAEKCIQLANEVFGFNGWSSQIKELQVDFVDENPTSGKVSLGLSVIVRVSLRDGTFHEDIGYGHIENCKGKAAAFEKAKKEGTTDALKRALRNFGNVLGNCIYDKEYLAKVTKVKIAPTKWEVDGLYRHSDYAKKEEPARVINPKQEKDLLPSLASEETFEDEFDDGEFDVADFMTACDSNSHPDEVVLPAAVTVPTNADNFNASRPNNGPPPAAATTNSVSHQNQNRYPQSRPQQMPAPARPQPPITSQQLPDNNGGQQSGARSQQPQLQQQHPQHLPQPQTPKSGFSRSTSGAGRGMIQPQTDNSTKILQAAAPGVGRVLIQPSRQNPPQGGLNKLPSHKSEAVNQGMSPMGGSHSVGFFSAKAVMPTDGQAPGVPPVISTAAFNPHSESPSIRKTPGVDHTKSIPLGRNLKHIPSSKSEESSVPVKRGNILNPQLDATRRIGAPGSPSPLGNRGSYKPPTMTGKRPSDVGGGNGAMRPPLGEVRANEGMHQGSEHDIKRQRMNGA